MHRSKSVLKLVIIAGLSLLCIACSDSSERQPNRLQNPNLRFSTSLPAVATGSTIRLTVTTDSDSNTTWRIVGDDAEATIDNTGLVTAGATVEKVMIEVAVSETATHAAQTINTMLRVTDKADFDGDGLIEIYDHTMLHNMRYNLAGSSYKTAADDTGNMKGCPMRRGGCNGYELVRDLDFDKDDDGMTWSKGSDGYTLDNGDTAAPYFVTANGGWEPIGDESAPFAAIFEGNGYVIRNLAIRRDQQYIGFFGVSTGSIHNLGLENTLADYTGNSDETTGIAPLVGWMQSGAIIASHASGAAKGGNGDDDQVGGLAGYQQAGNITASHASATVQGESGNNDWVGGLVGYQQAGNITASHASGSVNGGDGIDRVGGLAGRQNGDITASYATGSVNGGDGNSDTVGGLVGWQNGGTLTASYATGAADGGAGETDRAGSLVGWPQGGTITASYGFGTATGETMTERSDGNPKPDGVASATGLNATNAGDEWNKADSGTLGIWNFGDGNQPPAVVYNDYDGADNGTDHCALFTTTRCGALIPGQRPGTSPQFSDGDITFANPGTGAGNVVGPVNLPITSTIGGVSVDLAWDVFHDPEENETSRVTIGSNRLMVANSRATTRWIVLRARNRANNTTINDYHLRIIANPPRREPMRNRNQN